MSEIAKRALIWGVALASLSGLIWLLVGWLELEPITSLSRGFQPDVALQGTTLTHYEGMGQRLWSLTAQTITVDEKTRTTVAEAVEVRFWHAAGEGEPQEALALSVHAQRLVLDNVRQDMVFEGRLSANDAHGLEFATHDATWRQQEGVLEGEGIVTVQRGDLSLEGVGFRYDMQEGKFLLKGQARLRWMPEEEP